MSKRYNKQIGYSYAGNISATSITTGSINITGNIYQNNTLFSGGGESIWTTTGSGGVFYTSGNVGIGTTSPTSQLQISRIIVGSDQISSTRTNFLNMSNNNTNLIKNDPNDSKMSLGHGGYSSPVADFVYSNPNPSYPGAQIDYAIKYTGSTASTNRNFTLTASTTSTITMAPIKKKTIEAKMGKEWYDKHIKAPETKKVKYSFS
jgi:hypothetical protein